MPTKHHAPLKEGHVPAAQVEKFCIYVDSFCFDSENADIRCAMGRYLKGIQFPASKLKLLDQAKENGAPHPVWKFFNFFFQKNTSEMNQL